MKKICCDICGKPIKSRKEIFLFSRDFNPFSLISLHKNCYLKEKNRDSKYYRRLYFIRKRRVFGFSLREATFYPILSKNFNIAFVIFIIVGGFLLWGYKSKLMLVIYVIGFIIFFYVIALSYFKYLRYLPKR